MNCQKKVYEGEHYAQCTQPGVCLVCGESDVTIAEVLHDWQLKSETAEKEVYVCLMCGETETILLTTPTPMPTPVPIPEPTVVPTPEPHVHQWVVAKDTQATCTEDGARRTYCTGCDLTTAIDRPALGHDFNAFAALGDGTHIRTCKRCGAVETGACHMAESDLEAVRATSCTECGYTVYMVQTVEMPAEVQVAMAPVEDVAVELPAAAETSFELVVHETNTELAESVAQAMEQLVTAALPENTPVTVKKLLNVTMLVENEIVQPGAKLRLTLSCDMDMTNMRLMLLRDNGELIEIEYEVIDGKLVFETEYLGLFLFVENKAA